MKNSPSSSKKSVPRRGGRPSLKDAAHIEDQILDVAEELFFTQGYGLTSIEKIAKKAGISKRTFYHRFADKAAIFRSVVHRVLEQLQPSDVNFLFQGQEMEAILYKIAEAILHAALSPKTLALHRIIIAEATRFPELALAVTQQGTRQEAIKRIAALLSKDAPLSSTHNAVFAAEQFIHMLIAAPQRRALGMEKPLTAQELKMWVTDTIRLFLHGYHC